MFIEAGAGVGSSITDEEYVAAGATIVDAAEAAWGTGGEVDLVLKVKEPVAEEYHRMREGQLLFTYLHLAADRPLTDELIERRVTGIAYETVQPADGGLPLLYPMSEVAGCLAPQVGAHALLKAQGGRGVLLGGVGGVAEREGRHHRRRRLGAERREHRRWAWAPTSRCSTPTWTSCGCRFWRYNNRVHGLASSKLAIEQHVIGRGPRDRGGAACPVPRHRSWSPTSWCRG